MNRLTVSEMYVEEARMSADAITAIATIFLAVAAIVTLVWQTRSFRLSLAADLSMKLDDRFQDKEFAAIRSRAARALKGHIAEDEAEDVFDFFETIGMFVRLRALNAEIAHNFFFHWINLYWVAGRDHIRRKQATAKSLWRDFESLHKKVLDIERRKDPTSKDLELTADAIDRYLDDEIALI